MYNSQYKQDQFLDQQLFKGKESGFFIDIGAHDGVTYSNTYFFEKERKWKGICIEPHPDVFKKLATSRQSVLMNCAVGKNEGLMEFVKITGYSEMLSGLKSSYETKHLERIKEEIETHGGTQEAILIGCKRLDRILQENNVSHVDYCSIDVEGGEMDVLETVDLKKQHIEVFTIENNYRDTKLKKFLSGFNYKMVCKLHCDEVYQRRKSFFHFISK